MGGAVDGGHRSHNLCPPACITNAGQILEIQIRTASDYTWFPLHPPLRNVDSCRAWQRTVKTMQTINDNSSNTNTNNDNNNDNKHDINSDSSSNNTNNNNNNNNDNSNTIVASSSSNTKYTP